MLFWEFGTLIKVGIFFFLTITLVRSQKCIQIWLASIETNFIAKKLANFAGSLSGYFRVAAASSPVNSWMGDRLDPRSKSGLQLEKLFFYFFHDSISFWAFSRNFDHSKLLSNWNAWIFIKKSCLSSFKKHKNWIFSKRARSNFLSYGPFINPHGVLGWDGSHSPGSFQIHPNPVQAPCGPFKLKMASSSLT